MWAPLPVGVENAAEVLRKIASSMDELKKSGQAVGAQVLTNLAGFAPPTILSQAARLQARQPFFNLVVTNVPGPQFPLYLLGRRLEILYPVVPLAQKQALGIAVMSYDGHLGFGLLGRLRRAPGHRGTGARPEVGRRGPLPGGRRTTAGGHHPQVERQAHHRQLQPSQLQLPNRGQATRRNQLAAPGMRLALGQINTTVGDVAGNAELVRDGIRAARREQADLVLFPELALTGYPPEDLLLKEHFLADAPEALSGLASEADGIVALVGFPERADDVYNALAVLADGRRPRRLPQGVPAQLRRLRRAALLPGGPLGRRHRAGSGPHRADDLRGHLGAGPARPATRPSPGRR